MEANQIQNAAAEAQKMILSKIFQANQDIPTQKAKKQMFTIRRNVLLPEKAEMLPCTKKRTDNTR